MRILTGREILNHNFNCSVLTIGNFDGVHLGHKALFKRLTDYSQKHALTSVVVTFDPHPLSILMPEIAPKLIATFEQKVALIEETAVDILAVIDFTPEFSQIPAEQFVRETLFEALGMKHIIIGHDYAFGRDRHGNYETLEKLGEQLGFTVEDIDPVGDGKTVFSSSLARRLINSGDIPEATAILGRYPVVSGKVVHGRDIGQSLGFPTANIETENELIPSDGVYAVMVSVVGRLFQGACSIGINPTFEGGKRSIEVFLLDFSGVLYGQEIAICFVKRLRGVIKFPDIAALIAAISQDVINCKLALASVRPELVKPLLHLRQPESLDEKKD